MASTQTWSEWNGTSPGTETASRSEANLKNIDDSTSNYASFPTQAGNNSFWKIFGIVFNGTWNSLSALTYKVSSNAPATGVSIAGSVVSSYSQPATTASGDSAMSTSGASANFVSSTTPFGAGTSSSTASGKMYAQPVRLQLQTTTSAGPGDIPSQTLTAAWTES